MKLFKRLQKACSLLVLSCFVLTDMVWAIPVGGISISPKPEIPAFLRVDIPKDLASIEEVYQAPATQDPKMILHIQDLHGNFEAQKNISGLLDYLHQTYGFNLVFVEGASEPLNPDYLKLFEDDERNKKLANYLAENSELSGAEMFVLEHPQAIKAVGIEDVDLYKKNYEAFKRVHKQEFSVNQFLDSLKARLDRLGSLYFSKDLLRLTKEWRKFNEGHREFLPFVKRLAQETKRFTGLDLQSLFAQIEWPQITRLLVVQEMEQGLDYDQAEKEKQRLIRFLREKNISESIIEGVRKLGDREIAMTSLAASKDQLETLPRYLLERLIEEAGPKGFYFYDYPQFSLYAGYTILQSELDSKMLFKEIERVFEKVLSQLATTEKQKNVIELFRDSELIRKLFTLELNHEEWNRVQYREGWISPQTIENRISTIEKERGGILSESLTKELLPNIKEVFHAAFDFYGYARDRDQQFFEKVNDGMMEQGSNKAVVVAGGFHTDGLMELLRINQMSYGVLMPKVRGVVTQGRYKENMLGTRQTMFDVNTLSAVIKLMSKEAKVGQGLERVLSEFKAVLNAYVQFDSFDSELDFKRSIQHFNDSIYVQGLGIRLDYDEKEKQAYVFFREKDDYWKDSEGNLIAIPLEDSAWGFADHVNSVAPQVDLSSRLAEPNKLPIPPAPQTELVAKSETRSPKLISQVHEVFEYFMKKALEKEYTSIQILDGNSDVIQEEYGDQYAGELVMVAQTDDFELDFLKPLVLSAPSTPEFKDAFYGTVLGWAETATQGLVESGVSEWNARTSYDAEEGLYYLPFENPGESGRQYELSVTYHVDRMRQADEPDSGSFSERDELGDASESLSIVVNRVSASRSESRLPVLLGDLVLGLTDSTSLGAVGVAAVSAGYVLYQALKGNQSNAQQTLTSLTKLKQRIENNDYAILANPKWDYRIHYQRIVTAARRYQHDHAQVNALRTRGGSDSKNISQTLLDRQRAHVLAKETFESLLIGIQVRGARNADSKRISEMIERIGSRLKNRKLRPLFVAAMDSLSIDVPTQSRVGRAAARFGRSETRASVLPEMVETSLSLQTTGGFQFDIDLSEERGIVLREIDETTGQWHIVKIDLPEKGEEILLGRQAQGSHFFQSRAYSGTQIAVKQNAGGDFFIRNLSRHGTFSATTAQRLPETWVPFNELIEKDLQKLAVDQMTWDNIESIEAIERSLGAAFGYLGENEVSGIRMNLVDSRYPDTSPGVELERPIAKQNLVAKRVTLELRSALDLVESLLPRYLRQHPLSLRVESGENGAYWLTLDNKVARGTRSETRVQTVTQKGLEITTGDLDAVRQFGINPERSRFAPAKQPSGSKGGVNRLGADVLERIGLNPNLVKDVVGTQATTPSQTVTPTPPKTSVVERSALSPELQAQIVLLNESFGVELGGDYEITESADVTIQLLQVTRGIEQLEGLVRNGEVSPNLVRFAERISQGLIDSIAQDMAEKAKANKVKIPNQTVAGVSVVTSQVPSLDEIWDVFDSFRLNKGQHLAYVLGVPSSELAQARARIRDYERLALANGFEKRIIFKVVNGENPSRVINALKGVKSVLYSNILKTDPYFNKNQNIVSYFEGEYQQAVDPDFHTGTLVFSDSLTSDDRGASRVGLLGLAIYDGDYGLLNKDYGSTVFELRKTDRRLVINPEGLENWTGLWADIAASARISRSA